MAIYLDYCMGYNKCVDLMKIALIAPKEQVEDEVIEGGSVLRYRRNRLSGSALPVGNNVKTVPLVNLRPDNLVKNLQQLQFKGKGVKSNNIRFVI